MTKTDTRSTSYDRIFQVFFDCLRERISSGGTKKRLPNYTDAFVRKDALPIGTFTKYTWHITNILHVKQIFETPQVRRRVGRDNWRQLFIYIVFRFRCRLPRLSYKTGMVLMRSMF